MTPVHQGVGGTWLVYDTHRLLTNSKVNRVSNATVPSKWLYSINKQISIYKSMSGFSCFLIGYLFIDT